MVSYLRIMEKPPEKEIKEITKQSMYFADMYSSRNFIIELV